MSNGVAATLLLACLVAPLAACGERATLQAPAAKRAWHLTPDGVLSQRGTAQENVVTSLPGWLWAGRAHACPPVLAVGPRGEALVTSNVVPTLWRVDPDTLAVSMHALALDADTDKDVGFARLFYSPKHGAFFAVGSTQGSLWKIDPQLRSAQKIALAAPMANACGDARHG